MPYLGYVNTLNYTMYSDTVMNSYKYRHYLFGVQYDEYNKRKNYIYAIPGKKAEQPDKGQQDLQHINHVTLEVIN